MENTELLKNKILLFNNFLINRLGVSKDFFIETNQLIEKAYEEKNIKVLKSGNREIYLQIKEMPLDVQLELKELFKGKLDIDLEIFHKIFHKKIEKIIKRGKILNDDEYRLLLDKMDNTTEAKSEVEINTINTLLINYQERNIE